MPDLRSAKIRIGIVYGGKSAEREVSLRSAKNVLQALDPNRFEPVCIGIDRSGKWLLDPQQNMMNGADKGNVQIAPIPGGKGRLLSVDGSSIQENLDVIFPVLHGPMGEDGTMQGLLELAGIPYVGPGVLGSAIGMDKDVMKRLLREAGIAVTDFVVIKNSDIGHLRPKELVQRLGLPLFVKPANMGSSVGVSRVASIAELKTAITHALQFDTKVLVEKAVVGEEIECAVLGNDSTEASVIGRIIPRSADFYSYNTKYLDENGATTEIPADIPHEASEQARAIALQTFSTLGCEGMARVDMFLKPDGMIIVNEINTIPGFTNISMYPQLWEASGLSYTKLITRLIELALERFKQREQLVTDHKNTDLV